MFCALCINLSSTDQTIEQKCYSHEIELAKVSGKDEFILMIVADKLSKDLITSCLKPSDFQVGFKMQKYKVIYSVCKSLQQLACKHRNKSSCSAYTVLFWKVHTVSTLKIIENILTFLPKKWKTSIYSQIYWLMYTTLICSCRKMENAPSSISHALHFLTWFSLNPCWSLSMCYRLYLKTPTKFKPAEWTLLLCHH